MSCYSNVLSLQMDDYFFIKKSCLDSYYFAQVKNDKLFWLFFLFKKKWRTENILESHNVI